MAFTITTQHTDVSALWTTYIIRKAVPGLRGNLVLADYARPAMVPKGAGGYIGRWLVPTMRRGSTTALAQTFSTIGAINFVTITAVEATLADYGEYFAIGDLAMNTEITEALDIYADIVAYAGATCIDDLLWNAAKTAGSGFSNYFVSRATTINSTLSLTPGGGDTLMLQDLVRAAGYLQGVDCPGIPSLNGDYLVLLNPNVEAQLLTNVSTSVLSWTDQNKYVPKGYEQLYENHRMVGRWGGMSILRSTTAVSATHGVIGYASLIMGDYGLGWLGLGEEGPKAPRIITKHPGPTSTNDPLDMIHTMGWKVRAVARCLDRGSRGLIIYSSQS